MTKAMMAALLAATMGTGFAAAPAAAQISIQLGDSDTVHDRNADRRDRKLENRENRVAAEGERRSDYLRSKGNYSAANKVENRYDRKLDKIDDQQARNDRYRERHDNDGLTINLN